MRTHAPATRQRGRSKPWSFGESVVTPTGETVGAGASRHGGRDACGSSNVRGRARLGAFHASLTRRIGARHRGPDEQGSTARTNERRQRTGGASDQGQLALGGLPRTEACATTVSERRLERPPSGVVLRLQIGDERYRCRGRTSPIAQNPVTIVPERDSCDEPNVWHASTVSAMQPTYMTFRHSSRGLIEPHSGRGTHH